MFVHDMPEAARAELLTIADDAKLIEAAGLLTSGTDMVVVCDGGSILQASSPKPTWSGRSAPAGARRATSRLTQS